MEWVQAQFGRSKPIDCSLMPRLESDFGQMKQINPKFKLTVDTTSLKTFVPIAYYSWNRPREDELYREYKSGEGQVARCIIEQLIETFSSNRNLLLLKTINLIS